jgi:hypothetical protein
MRDDQTDKVDGLGGLEGFIVYGQTGSSKLVRRP